MNTLGSSGEALASNFLKNKGYVILEKNYTTPLGEIDIIAKDSGIIVFIEVKTRANDSFGYPFQAVNARKRKKLKKIALLYMKHLREEVPARFDVLSIQTHAEGTYSIQHITDAFEV